MMSKLFNRLLTIVIFCTLSAAGTGQSLREQVLDPVTRSGGSSMSYACLAQEYTPAPAGFEPFYINHLGRHGSRYHTSESLFPSLCSMLSSAAEAGQLTPRGEELRQRLERVAKAMKKRTGDLTQKGAAEHAAIAARMAANYPGVFADGGKIYARSTLPTRCVLSMASFCGELRANYPSLRIAMESSDANNYYMNHYSGEYREYYDNGPWKAIHKSFQREMIVPGRLLGDIFTKLPHKIGDGVDFMNQLWYAASIMQDMDFDISIYDFFTDDEIFAMWQVHNLSQYLRKGPSAVGGPLALSIAKPMLRDFLKTAQAAVAGQGTIADLRFAHGENIMPFTALTGIAEASCVEADPHRVAYVWQDWRVTPMAANVQWIFYRDPSGEIILKVLLNERETSIPVKPFSGPYYRWEDVSAYYSGIAAE